MATAPSVKGRLGRWVLNLHPHFHKNTQSECDEPHHYAYKQTGDRLADSDRLIGIILRCEAAKI